MNPWRAPFIPPRPIIRGAGLKYNEWPCTPGAVSGTEDETKYSGYITLDPAPTGVGLFSIPKALLNLAAGGNLNALVEFWGPDENGTDELIKTVSLAELGAYIQALSYTDYTFPDISNDPQFTTTGRTSSEWANLSTPLPAGNYILYGALDKAPGVGTSITNPANPSSFVLSGSVELENVGEFKMYDASGSASDNGHTQTFTITSAGPDFSFSVSTPVTKVRSHTDVSTLQNCKGYGSACWGVRARRLY